MWKRGMIKIDGPSLVGSVVPMTCAFGVTYRIKVTVTVGDKTTRYTIDYDTDPEDFSQDQRILHLDLLLGERARQSDGAEPMLSTSHVCVVRAAADNDGTAKTEILLKDPADLIPGGIGVSDGEQVIRWDAIADAREDKTTDGDLPGMVMSDVRKHALWSAEVAEAESVEDNQWVWLFLDPPIIVTIAYDEDARKLVASGANERPVTLTTVNRESTPQDIEHQIRKELEQTKGWDPSVIQLYGPEEIYHGTDVVPGEVGSWVKNISESVMPKHQASSGEVARKPDAKPAERAVVAAATACERRPAGKDTSGMGESQTAHLPAEQGVAAQSDSEFRSAEADATTVAEPDTGVPSDSAGGMISGLWMCASGCFACGSRSVPSDGAEPMLAATGPGVSARSR